MTHLLDDTQLLIGRAEQQLETLRKEIDSAELPEVIVEDGDNTSEQVLHFAQEPVLPREWGADIGQLVNNARTALDHLVYALSIEGGGEPEGERTAFPIFEKRSEYEKAWGRGNRKTTVRDRYLAGVDEKWRKRIDAVQPFRNSSRASQDPLAVLSHIANWHKHKTMISVYATLEAPAHFAFATTGWASDVRLRVDYDRNDVSVEADMADRGRTLTPPSLVLIPKQQVDGVIGSGLIFGNAPRFYRLAQIERTVTWSRSVIKWLEPAFDD